MLTWIGLQLWLHNTNLCTFIPIITALFTIGPGKPSRPKRNRLQIKSPEGKKENSRKRLCKISTIRKKNWLADGSKRNAKILCLDFKKSKSNKKDKSRKSKRNWATWSKSTNKCTNIIWKRKMHLKIPIKEYKLKRQRKGFQSSKRSNKFSKAENNQL